MTTKFVLRVQKMDAAGRCPVYLMAYFDGLRLVHSTGEKCKPSDWNADRQKFRASYPLAEEANILLTRLTAEALAWWRKLRAAGEAPTLSGLREVLRPATAPEAAAIEQESVTVWYDKYRRSMKARGYAFETLRHNLVTRNWMACFEKWSGAMLDPTSHNMALNDRLMVYLREERRLAPNSVATAIKDLKTFLRWLRDERGVAVSVDISKLVIKSFDTPKLYLTATELEHIASAMLPANLVPTRDIFAVLLLHRAALLGRVGAAPGPPARMGRRAAAAADDEQDAGRGEHLPDGGGFGHSG